MGIGMVMRTEMEANDNDGLTADDFQIVHIDIESGKRT